MAEIHTIKKVVITHFRCTSLSLADELTSSKKNVLTAWQSPSHVIVSLSSLFHAVPRRLCTKSMGQFSEQPGSESLRILWAIRRKVQPHPESRDVTCVDLHLQIQGVRVDCEDVQPRMLSFFFTRPKREQH